MRTHALTWSLLALAVGCKDTPPKGKETVTVSFDHGELAGMTIKLAGQTATLSEGSRPWVLFAFDKLPAPEPTEALLEVASACGAKQIPVPVTVTERFPGKLQMRGKLTAPLKSTGVWVDAPPGTEIAIGGWKLVTATAKGPRYVLDLACAPQHDVMVAGAKVGTVDSASTDGIFVTATPAACYQLASKGYGAAPEPPPKVLRDASVHRVPPALSYFLDSAPTSVKVDPGIKVVYKSELTKIACP